MMFEEAAYIRLRGKLQVDQQNLGEELIQGAATLQETLEFTVQASQRAEVAAAAYKVAVVIAAAQIREILINGKKRSETEINAEAPLSEEAQEAAAEVSDAKADLSYWQALAESTRAKLSNLKRLSDLTVAGYMATGSAYTSDREGLAAARRAANIPRRAITPKD